MRKQDADRSHEAESGDRAGKGTHGDDKEEFLWVMSALPGSPDVGRVHAKAQ